MAVNGTRWRGKEGIRWRWAMVEKERVGGISAVEVG